MTTTLTTERAWLERIEQSQIVGFCFLDADGQMVQRLDADPALREAIVEYQAERVRQLALWEPGNRPMSPVTYATAIAST